MHNHVQGHKNAKVCKQTFDGSCTNKTGSLHLEAAARIELPSVGQGSWQTLTAVIFSIHVVQQQNKYFATNNLCDASTHTVRAFHFADVGITTDTTCNISSTCVVLALVAGRKDCQPRPGSQ